jgi:hypothetical protein
MVKVWCYDFENERYFIKEFLNQKKFKNFENKCKYSKKIKIILKEFIEV